MRTISILFLLFFGYGAKADLVQELHKPWNQKILDELTRTTETLNDIQILHLGKASLPERVRLIQEAKKYVFISYPYWYSDSVSTMLADELQLRLISSPLDVKIMWDWLTSGSAGDVFGVRMKKRLQGMLGDNFHEWNRPWAHRTHSLDIFGQRLHEKFFIRDGQELIVGSMNIADKHLEGGTTRSGWHDTDLLIRGPMVQLTTAYFLKLWLIDQYFDSTKHFPIEQVERAQILQNFFYKDINASQIQIWDPLYGTHGHQWPKISYTVNFEVEKFQKYFDDLKENLAEENTLSSLGVPSRMIYDNPLIDQIVPDLPRYSRLGPVGDIYSKVMTTTYFLLERTKRNLDIIVPYFVPNESLLKKVEDVVKRGVRVRLLVNSHWSHTESDLPHIGAVYYYRRLINSGIELYEWQGHHPLFQLEKEHNCSIPDGAWPGFTLHTKAMIFDDEVTLIGSHNLNQRSEKLNSDLMVLVRDQGFSANVKNILESDLKAPADITIRCGQTEYPRPWMVERITLDVLNTKYKEIEKQSKFYHHLKDFM